MSLLLLSRLRKSHSKLANRPGLVDSEALDLQKIKRDRIWLFTYIALFTSLLAFFILMISIVELEGSTAKRNYQKLVHILYQETVRQKELHGLSWLTVENTLSKGIRLTMAPDVITDSALFESASAQINPRYLPYIRSFAEVIRDIELQKFSERNKGLIRGIESKGYQFQLFIRVEGHTDSNPLAATAYFKDNVELSTFRAYAMMDLIHIYTGLPRSFFAIAGYGSFRPLMADTTQALNRRVEVYLLPQLMMADPNQPMAKEESLL